MMSGERGSDGGSDQWNEAPAPVRDSLGEEPPILPLPISRTSRAARWRAPTLQPVAASERDFNEIYALFRGKIFDRIGRQVGAVPEREDLTQSVFLALHCALPQFRGEASLQTFLYQITTHVIFDHLRRRRRRITAVDADDIDKVPDEHPTPEVLSGARELLATVNQLLPNMKPVHRMALQLVVLEGLSLADAADRMGAKPHAVRQRLSKARREIAAMLERSSKPAIPPVRHGAARAGRGTGVSSADFRREVADGNAAEPARVRPPRPRSLR